MILKQLFSKKLVFNLLLIIFTSSSNIQASTNQQPTLIGPMVGSTTMRSIKLWAQLENLPQKSNYSVYVEYTPINNQSNLLKLESKKTLPIRLNAQNKNYIWQINELEPGTTYQYRIYAKHGNQKIISKPLTFTTETLWHWRQDPPNLRVLASSCAYTNDAMDDRPGKPYGQGNQIFESMAKMQPNLTLWLGDNIYFREPDFGDAKAMAKRYDKWRSLPELQNLLQTGSHLATWDDHDYGENDSNSSNPMKDISLALFKTYWPNPSFGLSSTSGVFTQYKSSDVEFFVLDDRWYRDNDKLLDDVKWMLGNDQVRWLKNALLSSSATWKVILIGSQILNVNNKYEGWHHFEKESGEFFQWLELQKIPGIFFISGDRHFSVLLKKDRPSSYPLYELTCSPSSAGPFRGGRQEVQNNPLVFPGSVVTENNFCDLEFLGNSGNRKLQITLRDSNGKSLFTTTIAHTELR